MNASELEDLGAQIAQALAEGRTQGGEPVRASAPADLRDLTEVEARAAAAEAELAELNARQNNNGA